MIASVPPLPAPRPAPGWDELRLAVLAAAENCCAVGEDTAACAAVRDLAAQVTRVAFEEAVCAAREARAEARGFTAGLAAAGRRLRAIPAPR